MCSVGIVAYLISVPLTYFGCKVSITVNFKYINEIIRLLLATIFRLGQRIEDGGIFLVYEA